ncbi:sensor histidine kinase [Planomonospora parontospora]|uniref:sensor histidine kinase n=1 Tax=Planomonospora parontospora TaxID=58119 RepID=UPI0016713F4A|nr:histidine kinase [Planomonospora parontospora]GGL58508.1 ATPase [Planomonospora parontospora subsp. antibiotica]GII20204.1 ATPase [Planomonospora parontospora subsp. antibiotica]
MRSAVRGLRLLGAVVLGTVTALLDLAFLLPALPFARRGGVREAARRLAVLDARRLGLDPAALGLGAVRGDGREMRYLAARAPVGVLGGLVVVLLGIGAGFAGVLAWSWGRGLPFDGMSPTAPLLAYAALAGGVLLFLDLSGLVGVYALERRLAQRLLGPDPTEALRRRITELSESRAGVLAAVDAERRRIERDLHDGLQQRLVALSMLAGRARRGRPELLDQIHEQAQQAVGELREVAWRVYPSGLDSLGLADALAGVAERSAVPVKVVCELPARPPMAVETVSYFVVSEAVTNAAKHAGATAVTVEVRGDDTMVVVCVQDDGVGGADPAGGGLSGLARRVAALDGRFTVASPVGGPTVITAELPCG